jgi:hypothetical protein
VTTSAKYLDHLQAFPKRIDCREFLQRRRPHVHRSTLQIVILDIQTSAGKGGNFPPLPPAPRSPLYFGILGLVVVVRPRRHARRSTS